MGVIEGPSRRPCEMMIRRCADKSSACLRSVVRPRGRGFMSRGPRPRASGEDLVDFQVYLATADIRERLLLAKAVDDRRRLTTRCGPPHHQSECPLSSVAVMRMRTDDRTRLHSGR